MSLQGDGTALAKLLSHLIEVHPDAAIFATLLPSSRSEDSFAPLNLVLNELVEERLLSADRREEFLKEISEDRESEWHKYLRRAALDFLGEEGFVTARDLKKLPV
jgi:hypothetical protein